MKAILFSICAAALMAAPAYGQTPTKPAVMAKPPITAAPDLVTRSGKTYKQAQVFRVEPDGITYMYSGGMSKIDFTDLPETVCKQHGYDPQKAAQFAQADEAYQQQAFEENIQLGNAEMRRKNDLVAGTEVSAVAATPSDDKQHVNVVPVLDPNVRGGLKKIIKMSVDDLVTSPFSTEGELVELTGIREIKIKEVAPDDYQIHIRSKGWNTLYAHLSGKKADLAQRSPTLYVAVTDPKEDIVTVFGNNTTYHALDTMPQVIWSEPR